jgi:hypothetical protein
MRVLAGVVAAVLIVGAGVGGYLLAPKQESATLALEKLLQQPNVQRLELTGGANGTMNVYYAPGHPDVFVVGAGLDQPPSGKAYELWMFRGDTPVSGGCFAPENGDVLHEVDTDLSGDHRGVRCVSVRSDDEAGDERVDLIGLSAPR